MKQRILLYAAVYGGIGVLCGVLMALATKEGQPPVSFLLHTENGRTPKEPAAQAVAESQPIVERVEEQS